MPSLLAMVDRFPGLFCPGQVWYRDEPFAAAPCDDVPLPPPTRVIETPYAPPPDLIGVFGGALPRAAVLAHAYIEHPNDPAWRGYLWTADRDRDGQRVYVGGVANGRGFEIHRHLHLTEKWGVALWT